MGSVRASKRAKFWLEMGKVRDREIYTERFTQTPRETERQRQKKDTDTERQGRVTQTQRRGEDEGEESILQSENVMKVMG